MIQSTNYNPDIHHRRSIRLRDYDYSQAGLYFVTVCTQGKSCLFGNIENGEMTLNDVGRMIQKEWLALEGRFNHISLHETIVMPNHIHGIVEFVLINQSSETMDSVLPEEPCPVIGDVVGAFKSRSTNAYILGVEINGWQTFNRKLWQRNYYEHVIRNEKSYTEISEYIRFNAIRWIDDKYYV